MADKIRKNLLGRTVTVKREAMSDGALAKTRTVKSKSGGTISSKTSYKDAGSVAGKMRANKINKVAEKKVRDIRKTYGKIAKQGGDITNSNSPEGRAFKNAAMEAAKMGAAKTSMATKRGMKNAIKMNEARDEFERRPYRYDAEKVKKAMETGRGRKVQRVMRRDLKSGRPF